MNTVAADSSMMKRHGTMRTPRRGSQGRAPRQPEKTVIATAATSSVRVRVRFTRQQMAGTTSRRKAGVLARRLIFTFG